MTDLRCAMTDYLTVRRQLGFQLREAGRLRGDEADPGKTALTPLAPAEPEIEDEARAMVRLCRKIHLGHPELSAFNCEREIECEHERPSATDRVTVDRANRDLIEMREHIKGPPDQPRPSPKKTSWWRR